MNDELATRDAWCGVKREIKFLDLSYTIHDNVYMKTSILSARLNETELGDLDQLTQTSGLERSALLRFLIRKGIREMKVDFATKAYVENRVTLSRAAEMAGITQHEFILMMPDKQMNLHYDVEELDEDIRAFAL